MEEDALRLSFRERRTAGLRPGARWMPDYNAHHPLAGGGRKVRKGLPKAACPPRGFPGPSGSLSGGALEYYYTHHPGPAMGDGVFLIQVPARLSLVGERVPGSRPPWLPLRVASAVARLTDFGAVSLRVSAALLVPD